jgi:NTP pyrophosphatase (non-canonical NTP hydrolase)
MRLKLEFPRRTISSLAFQCAVRAFGRDHVGDKKVRAMRLLEEAVELAQALDVPREKLDKVLDVVYSRPKGVPEQELGGVAMTFAVICRTFGTELEWELERELDRELDRVRWQSLLKHFTKRNQEKLDLGLHPNA